MSDAGKWTILCPCCDATLIIDTATGAVISHEDKKKPIPSFEEMARNLKRGEQTRDQLFAQELNSQKNRERILDEKFREAMKRADTEKDKPYINPLDVD